MNDPAPQLYNDATVTYNSTAVYVANPSYRPVTKIGGSQIIPLGGNMRPNVSSLRSHR